MHVALIRHPDSRSDAASAIVVGVKRTDAVLTLDYCAGGAIRLPAETAPARADHLWQHTCFEAFIGVPGSDAYYEFNFSPSRQWAAYRFDMYRNGVEMVEGVAPRIEARMAGDRYQLTAELDLAALTDLSPDMTWRMALAAVIEGGDGGLAYWALKHRPGKPDFHHPDCFALELPPPSAG